MVNQDLLDYADFFASRGIGLINASAFGMGILSGSDTFPSWHPASDMTKDVCKEAAILCRNNKQELSSMALEWALSQKVVQTTVVSIVSREELNKNLKICLDTSIQKKSSDSLKETVESLINRLVCTHWENVEDIEYWAKLKQIGGSQSCDC